MAKKKTDTGQLDLFGESNTIQLLNGQIAMIEKKILALFGSTYKYAAQLAQVRDAVNSGNASFTFQSNPAAAKEIENRLTAVAQTLDQQLAKSTEQSYALGQASTNNALVQAFGKDKQTKKELKEISDDAVAAMRKRGADGHTFYTQPQGGVTISDRVWKLTESTKLELEIAIQNAVLEGQSADELARTIQQYLTHPDRLFRSIRVKDPTTGKWTGEYTMSEAAKRCHPGQGVYRSSYKNALRLARTELTQAYRRAEWETYQDNPLITGYRIELSNNHTTEVMTKQGRKTIPIKDICDKMAGTEYPKTFLWTGWHPQCRCRMVPILVTKNDFKERVKARHTGKLKEWQPKEQTTEMPKVFVEWVNDNKARWQANGKAAPFFIRDNYQQGDVDKGLDTRITAAIEEAKLAAATAKAKAKEPKKAEPKPITDYDVEIQALRDQAVKYELNLAEIEALRAGGNPKDKPALKNAIEEKQKLLNDRQGKWATAQMNAATALAQLNEALALVPDGDEKNNLVAQSNELEQQRMEYAPTGSHTYTEAIAKLAEIETQTKELTKQAEALRPQITEFDVRINLLRGASQWRFDLDLTKLEQLRAESKDRDALEKELERQEKEYDKRSKELDKAINNAKKKIKELESKKKELAKLEPSAPELTKFDAEITAAKDKQRDLFIHPSLQYLDEINEHNDIANRMEQLIQEADAAIAKVKPKETSPFDEDAYSKERKKNALSFTSKQYADNMYRGNTENLWANFTKAEKQALTAYTEGSGHMNKPLRGYDKTWLPQDFKGVGNVDLDNEGGKKHIEDATKAIAQAKTKHDMWLFRGWTSRIGAAAFLGVADLDEIVAMTQKERNAKFVGKIIKDEGFLSCGTAENTGFKGEMNARIYCPKGTQAIYAEPFSNFNGAIPDYTESNLWDGKAIHPFGNEFETIIQRGTEYRITKITTKGYTVNLELEVVGQI